jgi:hypothetical protein
MKIRLCFVRINSVFLNSSSFSNAVSHNRTRFRSFLDKFLPLLAHFLEYHLCFFLAVLFAGFEYLSVDISELTLNEERIKIIRMLEPYIGSWDPCYRSVQA